MQTLIRHAERPELTFPGGARYCLVIGDDNGAGVPVRTGIQTSPPGYRTEPHSHPYIELLTVLDGEAPAWNPIAAGLAGSRCQGGEGIAHEQRPCAVRDASRMAITGDLQILAREIVRVEPGIDDEQPSIVQTLHDLLVGEAGTPHIFIVWLIEDQGGNAIAFAR